MYMKLNNIRLREWMNEYFTRLCSLLSVRRDKRHMSVESPL